MKWRQGLHVPYNVYEGDRPICQTHTAMDARRICAAMNHSDGADILEDILAAVQQQGDAVEIWNRALDALFASLPVNAFYSRAFLMEKLNDLKTADLLTMPVGPAIIPPGTVPPKPEPTNAPALSNHFMFVKREGDLWPPLEESRRPPSPSNQLLPDRVVPLSEGTMRITYPPALSGLAHGMEPQPMPPDEGPSEAANPEPMPGTNADRDRAADDDIPF